MSASSSTGSEWEEVGLQGAGTPPSLEDFERARDNLRTPKRLKVGPLLASLVDTNPAGGVELAPLEDLEELPDEATDEDKEEYMRDSLELIPMKLNPLWKTMRWSLLEPSGICSAFWLP
jgi:hypothetical protein